MTRFAERRAGPCRSLPVAALLLGSLALSLTVRADAWLGRELVSVVEELRRGGLPILYSSRLVHAGMPVDEEPDGATPLARLVAALLPFGLDVRAGPYGSVLIVKAEATEQVPVAAVPAAAQWQAMSELIVTTSRYELLREPLAPLVSLPNTDVDRLPDLGDDPLRAVARLPGAAINGLSSKSNIRGAATDETLVTFDGLRLFNPFHLKDFQSIFSSIDPALIEGLDVYTGAFPAAYGDRLSGVVDIEAFEPPPDGYRLLAVSLFNAAGLVAGGWDDGRGTWLVSARRGNLDIILDLTDQDLGEPRYSDLHAQLGWEFSEQFKLSANALIFDDNISVFDSDVEEQATAEYHDSYLWLRADMAPTATVRGHALLSYSDLAVSRDGIADQPDISSGTLQERRSSGILGLATQWSLELNRSAQLEFGADLRSSRGRFYYADDVEFELLFDTPGAPTDMARSRTVAVSPDGEYYAAYLSTRLDLPGPWATELGLRWDRSTLASDSGELSPRVSLLVQVAESTALRASWGRYWQSQGIDELAVNDGETTFAEPELADQFVVGVEQEVGTRASLRVEAYTKEYRNPRNRYENLLNSFILLPELKPDRVRVSADSATARGLEVSIRSSDEGQLDWWGSYSWAEVRDEIDGARFRRSWDQSHALSAGLMWSNERWDLSAAAIYRSGWPTTLAFVADDGPADIVTTGPRNGERLDHYATLDLRAARRFPTDAGLVSVFLEISNSLNRRNYCCVEYGIDVDDTGEFEVGRQRNLPILPSVGFSWQF